MGRHAELEPKHDSAKKRWVISLPPALSASGQRSREYFKSKAEALERTAALKDLRGKSLKAVRRAGTDLIETAVNYDELFRNVYGLSGGLAQACEAHMRHLDGLGHGHLFGALLDAYHSDHSINWSSSRKTTWEWFIKQLAGFRDRSATTLDSEFWSEWLNQEAKGMGRPHLQRCGDPSVRRLAARTQPSQGVPQSDAGGQGTQDPAQARPGLRG